MEYNWNIIYLDGGWNGREARQSVRVIISTFTFPAPSAPLLRRLHHQFTFPPTACMPKVRVLVERG